MYVEKLCKEIKLAETASYLQQGKINAVFLGGGTPSVLDKDNIKKMLDTVNLPIDEITTETLRNYLSNYKKDSTAGMVTIDNIRRTLSSFFAKSIAS